MANLYDNPQRPDAPAARPITTEEVREMRHREFLRQVEAEQKKRNARSTSDGNSADPPRPFQTYVANFRKTAQIVPTATAETQTATCPTCAGMGAVTRNVPPGHPEFGKSYTCPDCGGGPRMIERRQRALDDQFGEVWMWRGRKMNQFDMQDFIELDDRFMRGKMDAIQQAYLWAHDEPGTPPFLLLTGDPGVGKTCLAASAFVKRVGVSTGIPIEYNAMMNLFLDAIRQDKSPTEYVNALATVPVLMLDDLGNTFRNGAETEGRQAWLFEIINRRDDRQLPTIITTNLSVSGLYQQFAAKTVGRLLENGDAYEMAGESLRLPYA